MPEPRRNLTGLVDSKGNPAYEKLHVPGSPRMDNGINYGIGVGEVRGSQSTVDPNANLRGQLNSSDPAVRERAQAEQRRRDEAEKEMDYLKYGPPHIFNDRFRNERLSATTQRNESYANRRLGIILETVSEILEDAKRARSRTELRQREAEDAGKRITSELARVGPGGVAKYDLDRLGMVIKGSAERIAAATELMKARQQHQGTDDAQRILDVDSYKFGISPPERKARYKARKKSGKKSGNK
jgi:hypothetical protein